MALAASALLAACGGGDDPVDGATAAESTSKGPSARILAASGDLSVGTGGAVTQPVFASVITVRAASNLVDDIGALLQLRYNGAVIATGEVRSSAPANLLFMVQSVINGGTLDVIVSNAEPVNGSAARLVTITEVLVNGTAFSPTGAGVTFDIGWGAAAFDGAHVRAGSTRIDSNGALRIPMPAASELGAMQPVDPSAVSADPGPYVDWSRGSDSNPGTIDRPFKTLARLTRNIVPLLPGENIHLRCGTLWRESIALGVSQLTDGTEILPYGGDCAQIGPPAVSGADTFNGGWTRNGAVWSRALPAWTPRITRLWVGNRVMRPAQWPNADAPMAVVHGAWTGEPWKFWMGPAETAALGSHSVAGATVMLRTQPWRIEKRYVADNGSQANQVALATIPDFPIQPGMSWVMRDKLWMLDAAGEYFHDIFAQRLYLIPHAQDASLDLNAASVEGSIRATAIELRGRSRLAVRGIAVRNAQADGLRLTNASQAVLIGVEARENGQAGVRLMQWDALPDTTPGPRVENSFFSANGEFGIDATYVRGAVIRGNRVEDTGTGVYVGPATAAISAGPHSRVEDNDINGAAYTGITFSSQGHNVVSGNEISNYCTRLTDCGAIYTWATQASTAQQHSSVIENNRIHGAVALSQGSPALDAHVVAGIYLDDFTQRAQVRGNFLENMPFGVFLHNASNTTVENNQIWLARRGALSVAMDRNDGDWSVGNVLRNNEIVPLTTASAVWPALPTFLVAHPVWFVHALAGSAALGGGRNDFSGNRVVQLNGVIPEHALVGGPQGVHKVDVATWREMNPGEPDVKRPLHFSPYSLALGPEKVTGGQFDGGLGSWQRHWNWQVPGFQVQPVWAQPGCNGPCVRMISADRGDAIMSPTLTLRAGVPHVYRWTALAEGARATVGLPYIARPDTWDNINDQRGFVTLSGRELMPGQVHHYEAFFAPAADLTAQVVLQLETLTTPVHFDAVSIREVLGWGFSGPREWASAVMAPRNAPKTVATCAELGWPAGCSLTNLDGAPLSLPLTVPAGRQAMVLWADSPSRR
ncbi:MAG: right-handed parallel beta-helix repeat-containing protein [Betaproteobacteria bacterium]|nr:right-handed parallel beta-helix repeat-containing protein [Betaproteobacteria bacterium]